MEFLLFPISGLILAIATFVASDSSSRRFVFYIFWLAGVICFVLSGLLFLSISAAERYAQIITPHTIFAVLGFFGIVVANLSSQSIGKTALFSKLIEEKQYRAASEITQLAASNSTLMELLNYSLEKLITLLGLAGGVIHVFHRARESLVLGSYMGLSPRLARRLETIEMGDTAIGRTAKNKRLLIIRDLRLSQDYEFFGGKQEGFSYMALIPIVSDGENWGVISLFGKGTYQPGSLQVDLLEQFGEQLGAALVLGREVRNTQTSRDSFSNLLKAIGDELSTAASGENAAVQGMAWMVTRHFGGDRYDIFSHSARGWKVILSSDASTVGKYLSPDTELESSTSTNGLRNWNQEPPFKELTSGKAYAYVSLNSGRDLLVIRLEGRRRAAVDLELLTDAFRVINGLRLQLTSAARHKVTETLRPVVRGDASEIERKLARVGGELGRLITAYSGAGESAQFRELFAWLEVIRRSLEEPVRRAEPGKPESTGEVDFGRIIRNAVDQISSRSAAYPEIILDNETSLPMPAFSSDLLTQSIMEFMTAALFGADSHSMLRLISRGDERFIHLELQGDGLAQIPGSAEKPNWLRNIGGRLESSRVQNDDGRILNAWRLHIPLNGVEIEDEAASPAAKVLVVDNQEIIRDLLKGMLTGLGLDPTVVSSPDDALAAFKSALQDGAPYRIVVADFVLERISGMELARELKRLDESIFFVILSGWGLGPENEEAARMGVDAILRKPFRIEQLSETIQAAVQGKL